MSGLRFNMRLGFTGGGGGAAGFNFSLDNQTIASTAVESGLVGNYIYANGIGPFTAQEPPDAIAFVYAPDDLIFSDTAVDDLSSIGTEVCTLSDTRSNGVMVNTIISDPDGKFGISGDSVVLIEAVDNSVAASHDLTLRRTNTEGEFFDQMETITVESAVAAITFNYTDVSSSIGATSATTYNHTANIGTPSDTRIVFVAFFKGATTGIPACTIDTGSGPVNAPLVFGGTSARSCSLFALEVLTGTEADIIVSHDNTNSHVFNVYEVHNLTSLTTVEEVLSNDGTGLLTCSIDTPIGEALVFAFGGMRSDDELATWVGSTETSFVALNNRVSISCAPFISNTEETPHTLTVSFAGSQAGNALAVVLQ